MIQFNIILELSSVKHYTTQIIRGGDVMNSDYNKDLIRELLIDCMHSDNKAENFFIESLNNLELLNILIGIVSDDYSEDAQISASFWISKFDKELLSKIEPELLMLQKCEYICIAGPIMVALGKINSKEGLKYLLDEVIGKTMKWEVEAIKEYKKNW